MSITEVTRLAIQALANFQKHSETAEWVRGWEEALDHDKSGSMRKWFIEHNGEEVETLQFVTNSLTDAVPQAWAPGARTVDARGTFVSFDGSSRSYAGMKVLATSADTLVVWSDWHVVIYRVSK